MTAEVRKHCSKPLMVKLTPNVTNIGDIAAAAADAGADALSLINTLTGMRIDIRTRRPILRNNTGGLSGSAVFPIAVRMVREVYKRVKVPVVGMGGISSWEDAAEMMLAGAAAVQVGTANFRDPFAAMKILEGLEAFAAGRRPFKRHRADRRRHRMVADKAVTFTDNSSGVKHDHFVSHPPL